MYAIMLVLAYAVSYFCTAIIYASKMFVTSAPILLASIGTVL
jgi:hypothetical protein